MRTSTRTIARRKHWRWQRCGPGRSELRRVLVRASTVTLAPTDLRQLDMLEARTGGAVERANRRRPARPAATSAEPRPVLRSYWRRQPFGPRGRLRRMMLIDVHA